MRVWSAAHTLSKRSFGRWDPPYSTSSGGRGPTLFNFVRWQEGHKPAARHISTCGQKSETHGETCTFRFELTVPAFRCGRFIVFRCNTKVTVSITLISAPVQPAAMTGTQLADTHADTCRRHQSIKPSTRRRRQRRKILTCSALPAGAARVTAIHSLADLSAWARSSELEWTRRARGSVAFTCRTTGGSTSMARCTSTPSSSGSATWATSTRSVHRRCSSRTKTRQAWMS